MTAMAFSAEEQLTLRLLVSRIIPRSATFDQPGADDPEIFADILKSGVNLQPQLASALADLVGRSEVTAEDATAFRQEHPEAAKRIETLTVQCYYRDARVLRALGKDPRPPFPKGYAQEPNDLSLLDPVRIRGEIYRKVP